eukprot:1011877-Pleurochrysis_carterae.AAC.1
MRQTRTPTQPLLHATMPQEQSALSPSDANESADAVFATHDVVVETSTAASAATDENANMTIA